MTRPITFDIESGGLNLHRSPILSVSWAEAGKGVQSLYARPERKTWLSRWAETQVWEPIKGKAQHSEKQVLEKFLNVLEAAPEGSTLQGWNIGYQAVAQDVQGKGPPGFDISALMTRSEKYGLSERYQAAFGKMHIRDIGQEYALKLADETAAFPHLIEQNLFEQLGGYKKSADITRSMYPGISEKGLAKNLALSEKRVAGWKQELLHDVVFPNIQQRAHESAFDVEAAERLGKYAGPIFKSAEDVQKWSRQALVNKLAASAKAGGAPLEQLLETARAPVAASGDLLPSVEGDLVGHLKKLAASSGASWDDVVAGKGFGKEAGRIIPSASLSTQLLGFGKRHKLALGIGVGIAGVWAANKISGKDDEYNTIEGLRHGGQAEKQRQRLTDFGSGWDALRGVVRASETFGEMIAGKEFQAALRSAQYGDELGRGAFGVVYQMKGEFRGQQLNFARKMGKLGEHEVATQAAFSGQFAPTVYGHSIQHLDMELMRGKTIKAMMEEGDFAAAEFLPAVDQLKSQYGKIHGDLHIGNVMVAKDSMGNSHLSIIDFGKAGPVQFSGFDDTFNTIEGLGHEGMAGILRGNTTDFGSGWRGLLGRLFGKKRVKGWSLTADDVKKMSHQDYYGHLKQKGAITESQFETTMKGFKERWGDKVNPVRLEEFEAHWAKNISWKDRWFGKNPIRKGDLAQIKAAEAKKNLELLGKMERPGPTNQASALTDMPTNAGARPVAKQYQETNKNSLIPTQQLAIDRMKKMQETHILAQKLSSTNSLRPGQRHTQTTGRIIK